MTAVLLQPGYEEEKLQRAAEQLACREAQAGMLLSLMGEVGMLIISEINVSFHVQLHILRLPVHNFALLILLSSSWRLHCLFNCFVV